MTTKHDTQEETSVVLAFAELDLLERDRADFASAKRAARERLDLQAGELEQLRARLLAERPHAWARARREQLRRRDVQRRAIAELNAQTEALHRQRLACYQAELEAKRVCLAAIESTPVVERPGRRVLEWSVPAAATALVAFLGFTLLGEDDAVARNADPVDTVAQQLVEAPAEPEAQAEPAPEVEAMIETEPEPEPEAAPAKPKSKSKPKSKPKPAKTTTTKPESTKHSNPLKLGDFGGNPLG